MNDLHAPHRTSKDGRLRYHYGDGPKGTVTVTLDGDWIFATQDRAKADAYLAGYDLARS